MSCFNSVSAITADSDLDLTKHVNYTSGMILGVDDFTQEFAYLDGRDRWLARDAIGYGTISGLSVRIEEDAEKGERVMVLPGVAVSPRGKFICIPSPQCAYLNQWLAANQTELRKRLKAASPPISSPPIGDEITLFVTLCYRDCLTDNVPIPGEPCRSEDELSAASRVKDDFSLELRFESPKQPEEEKVREYVEWLKKIKVVKAGKSTPLEDFLKEIRAHWLTPSSPPISSPPTVLQIHTKDICDYMRTAFRLWVTELRPVLSERKSGCAVEMSGGGSLEDCVLLAKLQIPLVEISTGWKVSDSKSVEVNEEKRPFLLHLRMLQEWMLCSLSQVIETNPPITSPNSPTSPVTLDDLSDVNAPSPSNDQTLIFKDGEWIAGTPTTGGGVTDHGALSGLDNDDHKKYLLADGKREMSGDLNVGSHKITNLKAAGNAGEAVVFEQAVKQNDKAGGDLSGTFSNQTVLRLQGNKVSEKVPQRNDILIWNGEAWTPQPQPEIPSQPSQKNQLILPLATVTRVKDNLYEIWFNIDAPGNLVRVVDFKEGHLRILDETDAPTTFTSKVGFRLTPTVRNVFMCTLALDTSQPEPDRMRFLFDISSIGVEISINNTVEQTLLGLYAEKNNVKFIGFFEGKLATVFVRGLVRLG